jgi:hypothetical protein
VQTGDDTYGIGCHLHDGIRHLTVEFFSLSGRNQVEAVGNPVQGLLVYAVFSHLFSSSFANVVGNQTGQVTQPAPSKQLYSAKGGQGK